LLVKFKFGAKDERGKLNNTENLNDKEAKWKLQI